MIEFIDEDIIRLLLHTDLLIRILSDEIYLILMLFMNIFQDIFIKLLTYELTSIFNILFENNSDLVLYTI